MVATPPHAAVLRSNDLSIRTATEPLEISQLRAVLDEQHYLKAGRPAAAKVSLNARGDEASGWSTAWKINFWARFLDGERACKLVRTLLRPAQKLGDLPVNHSGIYVNMLDACPPFRIDGNFGATAGIAEMLLQSHTGEIHLLPALPKAWSEGKITGLRARGGFTVDLELKDGKVINYRIASADPREVKVSINGETKTIQSAKR